MKWLFALLSLAVICYGDTVPSPYFRCDYNYSSDAKGWLKMHMEPADWASAAMRCRLEGAMLASPLTPELRQAMLSLWASKTMNSSISKAFFTGISALYSKYYFASMEGKPLSHLPIAWTDGAPTNFKENFECLVMMSDGRLDGAECNNELPYMCYRREDKLKFKTECGTTDQDYYFDKRTKSCYKFHYVARPWNMAYATCAAEDSRLAIVNSKEESEVLSDIVIHFSSSDDGHKTRWSKNNSRTDVHKIPAFIGFKKVDSWMPLTIEGQSLKEAGFEKYDFRSDGECGGLNDKGTLINMDCTEHRPFICERQQSTAECW